MQCYLCLTIIIPTTQNTNAAQHNNKGEQYGKYTADNKREIQLKGTETELKYIGVHSGDSGNVWRSVLEFRNWTALRTLDLSNALITQIVVKLMTLVLSSWAVCHGPT